MRPTNASDDAFYGVGHWLLERERFEDAKHVFRTMLLLAPADERAWLGLGISHEGVGELDAAARLYLLARQACVESARPALALGRVLRKLERDAEADDAYVDALALAEESDEAELLTMIRIEARVAA